MLTQDLKARHIGTRTGEQTTERDASRTGEAKFPGSERPKHKQMGDRTTDSGRLSDDPEKCNIPVVTSKAAKEKSLGSARLLGRQPNEHTLTNRGHPACRRQAWCQYVVGPVGKRYVVTLSNVSEKPAHFSARI